MTIRTNFRTEMRPFTGYDDPALPVGAWVAQGSITGDVSGGFVQMTFLFQFGQQEHNSQLYSVERAYIEVGEAAVTDHVGFIQTRNMDRMAPGRALFQRWAIRTLTDGSNNSVSAFASQAGFPMWLGQPFAALLECGVEVQFENINLAGFACVLQGYVWGPRSIIAPGGPQRPPNGFLSV